jgi:uncharacterized integral membrane protein
VHRGKTAVHFFIYMSGKTIFVLFLLLLLVIFIIQNTASVGVRVLLWRIQMSKALLIFLTFILGFICSYLISAYAEKKKKKGSG